MKAFIARDKNGELYIYLGRKPYKAKFSWTLYSGEPDDFKKIPDKYLFPEVKWEDEEPTEVSIKIVVKKAQQPQPQTKFDPNTLKPFDKVLVRNLKTSRWRCDHFSYIRDFGKHDVPHYMVATSYITSYMYCVPYNEYTKHLVGTTQEAPEYYRYWVD